MSTDLAIEAYPHLRNADLLSWRRLNSLDCAADPSDRLHPSLSLPDPLTCRTLAEQHISACYDVNYGNEPPSLLSPSMRAEALYNGIRTVCPDIPKLDIPPPLTLTATATEAAKHSTATARANSDRLHAHGLALEETVRGLAETANNLRIERETLIAAETTARQVCANTAEAAAAAAAELQAALGVAGTLQAQLKEARKLRKKTNDELSTQIAVHMQRCDDISAAIARARARAAAPPPPPSTELDSLTEKIATESEAAEKDEAAAAADAAAAAEAELRADDLRRLAGERRVQRTALERLQQRAAEAAANHADLGHQLAQLHSEVSLAEAAIAAAHKRRRLAEARIAEAEKAAEKKAAEAAAEAAEVESKLREAEHGLNSADAAHSRTLRLLETARTANAEKAAKLAELEEALRNDRNESCIRSVPATPMATPPPPPVNARKFTPAFTAIESPILARG